MHFIKFREHLRTSQDGDVGRNEICHETLWRGVAKFFTAGAYNVLHVVDTPHRILDIKGPLLMWCTSQALTSCSYLAKVEFHYARRKAACAGGSECEVKHEVRFINKITVQMSTSSYSCEQENLEKANVVESSNNPLITGKIFSE